MTAADARKEQNLNKALKAVEAAVAEGQERVVYVAYPKAEDISGVGPALSAQGFTVKGEGSTSFAILQIEW